MAFFVDYKYGLETLESNKLKNTFHAYKEHKTINFITRFYNHESTSNIGFE
jgi:hypothetical protein